MKYTGSCHCGQVKFEVDGELTGAMSCNCPKSRIWRGSAGRVSADVRPMRFSGCSSC